MKRITVVHFTNQPVRGGAEEHLLTLLTRLDRARFEPTLAAPAALLEKFGADLPADVEAIPLTLDSGTDLDSAWRFLEFLKSRRAGIVHSHMFQASKFASPIARLAGVPVVIETPHVRESWRKGWIKRSYFPDRVVGRLVDAFVAVSEANGEYLATEKGLPRDKIVVIRNGVSLRRFDPQREDAPKLRRELGFDRGNPVVVALARLEPQKGHRILLDAWKIVVNAVPQARLVCVGDGTCRRELETQALDLRRSVTFVGYQPNTADWLALAAFTVLPSFYEGLPLAAIESLAAARTVVATAVDGTTEVVVDGETGLTVPPGDSRKLAAAVCRLLADPDRARQLAQAGRRLVEDRFSEQRQVTETEALYLAAWRRRTGERVVITQAAAAGELR